MWGPKLAMFDPIPRSTTQKPNLEPRTHKVCQVFKQINVSFIYLFDLWILRKLLAVKLISVISSSVESLWFGGPVHYYYFTDCW